MQKGIIGHDPKIVTDYTKIVNKNTLLLSPPPEGESKKEKREGQATLGTR